MSDSDSSTSAPALKDWFNAERYRHIAQEVFALHPAFDVPRFLALTLPHLEPLSLMQRLRLTTESLHANLPAEFPEALAILKKLAPKLNHNFVTLVLPDYVAQYGVGHFSLSLEALAYFTTFGSAEFAIRPFLLHDQTGTLKVMKAWAEDDNEHVRRLASEGCRPRLPWGMRLPSLITDPTPALPILNRLRSDPSAYVRKSVANHLNDITKDHPDLVLGLLSSWPLESDAHSAWIARHALRTLIKKGHPQALAIIGAGEKAELSVHGFTISPQTLRIGERIDLELCLESRAAKPQRLVVDYAVHYVKKNGSASAKVFKWKELTLPAHATITLKRSQRIQDFTTRQHHPGHHAVDVMINGETMARSGFDLLA